MNTLNAVQEFHDACDIATPVKPCVPDWSVAAAIALGTAASLLEEAEVYLKRIARHQFEKPPACLLRAQLETGELAESLRAMAARDLVALLDAQADKRYVQDGTTLECGLGLVFDEAFERVHKSNMSKLVNGKAVKDATGKVQKGDWYTPVRLEDLIP